VRCARVSSEHQRPDLIRQIADLEASHPDHNETISDVCSGLNWKRRGFVALLDAVHAGSVEEVVVMHKDRLCRFGIEFVEWILSKAGCRLVVHCDDDAKNDTTELADDLLAVVTVFVARHNGNRSAENRRRRKRAAAGEAAQDEDQEQRPRKRARGKGPQNPALPDQ